MDIGFLRGVSDGFRIPPDPQATQADQSLADPWAAIKWDPKVGLVVTPDPNLIQSVRRVTRTDPKTGRTCRIVSVTFRNRARALLALGRGLGFV